LLKIYFEKWHTYIIINASYEGICVEFERKTTQLWFSYLQIARKYFINVKTFMTNPLNIIFDDVGI